MAAGIDDVALLTGLASAGVAGANNIIGTAANLWQSDKQRKWSEQMLNKQNAWNYEMWQAQNEYNSPENQVKRLRDAGLNPLFYGLDGSSAGDLSSAQPLGYQQASIPQLANPVSDLMSAMIDKAKVENLMTNTAKQAEEAATEAVRRANILQDTEKKKQEIENLKVQYNLTDSQTKQVDKYLEWYDRVQEAQIGLTQAQAALSQSQKNEIDTLVQSKLNKLDKEARNLDAVWNELQEEIKVKNREWKLKDKDLDYYAINAMDSGVKGSGISVKNAIIAGKAGIESYNKNHPKEEKYLDKNSESEVIRELVNSGQ